MIFLIFLWRITFASNCGDELFKGTSVTDRECVVRMPEIYENARGVVEIASAVVNGRLSMCTGWKVKHGATDAEGDLYLTTNHCVSESTTTPGQPETGGKAIFDYVSNDACPRYVGFQTEAQYEQIHDNDFSHAYAHNPSCDIIWVDWSTKQKPGSSIPAPANGGHRFYKHLVNSLDEFALFKLTCPESRSRPAIKLSGKPLEKNQGIYIVSHPHGWPQKVSMSGLETIGKQSQQAADRNKGLQTFLDERLDNQACRVINTTPQRNRVIRDGAYVNAPDENGVKYFHKYLYYCDSFGGSSGAPVFDALTHEAIMIHSNGGCHRTPALKESSDDVDRPAGNKGTWIGEPHILAMLREHGIPVNMGPGSQLPSEYRDAFQNGGQNFCPNKKETGASPSAANLALPKKRESNEFNVLINPSKFVLVSDSVKLNKAKAGNTAMCCLCRDGSLSHSVGGSCQQCERGGGTRARAVPSKMCQTKKDGVMPGNCANQCAKLFKPMCCLCANGDVSWSASGSCSDCAAIKDRCKPVKPRCNHMDNVNGPRTEQERGECVQECGKIYNPPPGLLALTATPGGAALPDFAGASIPLGSVMQKLAVDAGSGAWQVQMANYPKGWLARDAVELLKPQTDLSMGFGATLNACGDGGATQAVRFDNPDGFLAKTLKKQSPAWSPNGWRITRVNNERFDQMSPAAQTKCQNDIAALKANTLKGEISFTFENGNMANPELGKAAVQAGIVRDAHGRPRAGMDMLARGIQDQESRLVAVREVANIQECEQLCTNLLNCMGFEFKTKGGGKSECRPVFHLNSMARCPDGVEFHEKVERVLQPGRDDRAIPPEPLCCMCSNAEVKYSPTGLCVECGRDGFVQREIPPPGPCRYPPPDPLREDCDDFCSTHVFPPGSRMPARHRVAPPEAGQHHQAAPEDGDVGCFAAFCRMLGFGESAAQTAPGEVHVQATQPVASTETYFLPAFLFVSGAGLYFMTRQSKRTDSYEQLLDNDLEL